MKSNNSSKNSITDETTDVIEIDQRSLLEVYDKKHRYGKNLRYYYKEWQNINANNDSDLKTFFSWLDSPDCPDLEVCSRKDLEEDIVEYLNTDEERLPSKIDINAQDGLFYHQDCNTPLTTGPDGWIFVLNNFQLFAHEKITETSPRFHHSSFFAGKPVQFAGLFICTTGRIVTLFPHSGHYRPTEHHLYCLLLHLETILPQQLFEEIKIDAQRVVKISRINNDEVTKKKKRKICCQYLVEAPHLISFLRVKHMAWQFHGMFNELHDSLQSMGIQTEEDLIDAEEGDGQTRTAARNDFYSSHNRNNNDNNNNNNNNNNNINNSDISNNSSISEKSLSYHGTTLSDHYRTQLTPDTTTTITTTTTTNNNNSYVLSHGDITPPLPPPPPPPHHYQWNSPYSSPPYSRWNRIFDFSL